MNPINHLIKINPLKTLVAVSLLTSATGLLAQDQWVGNTDANWNTALNWSPANAPVAGDTLIFGSAGSSGSSLNNDLANGTVLNGITFLAGGAAWTLSGNDIGLNGTINNTNASAITINNNIILAADGTVNLRSAGSFTIAGVISDGGNGYGFTKAGTGSSMLTLSGANTFTGPLTINGGGVTLGTGISNLGAGTNIICGANSADSLVDGVGGLVIPDTYLITVKGSATAVFVNSGFPGTTVIAAQITGTGKCLKQSTTAPIEFSNDNNDYTNSFSQHYGTTLFTSVADGGLPSALGAGTGAYAVDNSASAAEFDFVGTNSCSTTRPIAWSATTGRFTLAADGVGNATVKFLAADAVRTGSGNAPITFRGDNAGYNVFAQSINDGVASGTTSVSKLNGSTWILSGNNTYSGGTLLGNGGSGGNAGILEFTAPSALPGYSTPGSVHLTTGGVNGGQVTLGVQVGGSGWTSANVDTLLGAATFDDDSTALGIDTINGDFTYGTSISQAIGLAKLGGNTLTLTGASTYTGRTTVQAGTLLVNGSIGSGALFVQTDAVLGGSGLVASTNLTVQLDGTIQGGNATGSGTLTVNNLNLGATGNTTIPTASQFNIAAGGKIAATTLSVNGTNTINILDASLPVGTNTLFTYTGTLGGNGFAGFQLGTLPSGVTANLLDTGSAIQLAVTAVSGGSPTQPAQILGVTVSGGNLVINGTNLNGGSSFHYTVLASTNLALPLTNWTVLSTNAFNADGTFTYTNAINPAMPTEFFNTKAVQ